MIYLISQEWSNTKGNHAGMVHLCNLLKSAHDKEIEHIRVPYINIRFSRIYYHIYYFILAIYMCFKVKKSDKVILMEYLLTTRKQYFIAYFLKIFVGCKVIGLAHLTPIDLDKQFSDKKLSRWVKPLDGILTLGSSLSSYFAKRNVNCKIITSFHYVDSDYYKPYNRAENTKLKAIFIGTMQRDRESLEKIIEASPNIDFIYCKGKSKINTSHLLKYKNLTIKGYLSELELKEAMNSSDISINLMYDTIGSNVITTSLAMGLVMLVSDVGSIRDYCTEDNTIFCNNTNEFINALEMLSNDINKVKLMKKSSYERSKNFSIESFYSFIVNNI